MTQDSAPRRRVTRKPRQTIFQKIKAWIKKIGTLNFILILVGIFFLWFNWQMLSIFRMYGSIPETYACAVIAATIGECGICGWIRTNKDKHRDHEWEMEEKKKREEDAEG